MLKQCLPVLFAAGLMSIAAPFAATQDSPSNKLSSPPSHTNNYGCRWPPNAAEYTRQLTKKLKLTSDQQTKVLDILQSELSQEDGLRQDSSLSPEERNAKMMDIRIDHDRQINALLSSNQHKKWVEFMAHFVPWDENYCHHGPSNGGDLQAPPPQQ